MIYVIKKGNDSAVENNENLNLLSTFERGYQLTLKEISQKITRQQAAKTQMFYRGSNDLN